ncbi:GIY-YIG nuclease family protein [Bifidobacterium choloepi]|uniref:GIY-YIG nuclease family protein n=1 Tax=Bifidobacterium choloepi TaxID=2614131 RepID=A0A6I5MZG3_9BIFI|nr:GIY-YIG nuclease family protein [Bifidobacterium choloepi]NEG69215.1 GIY-YIG nuclease family protein [Bifidobacterium choloepi]
MGDTDLNVMTVTMQIIDGNPDGIRICRWEGESMITVVVPRTLVAQAGRLPGLPYRGVYYLLDDMHGQVGRIYIGQTTQGINRLDAHVVRKDFWKVAVMFLDSDDNLDRDVLDGLEATLIARAHRDGLHDLDNRARPAAATNPYRKRRIRELADNIQLRMRVLGFPVSGQSNSDNRKHAGKRRQDPTATTMPPTNRRTSPPPTSHATNRTLESPPTIFHTRRNGITGRAIYDPATGSMTVLAGSQVDLTRPVVNSATVIGERERLFHDMTGVTRLDENITFTSPSAAATFVLGGSVNGWIEWVDDNDYTLDHLHRRRGLSDTKLALPNIDGMETGRPAKAPTATK